ncbi:MAG: NAD(P)-dependent oxidoreductase [Burkholderiaceae bacterium]|jgi:3-hydroxyisobutyrate dehydrogenase|nr:NAD(P)-dependent oxidoreductase [Burkholderiaceae bacterium]
MKVGLIGAGNIGQHFATRILAAGHELVIFDLNKDVLSRFKALGAEVAEGVSDLASRTTDVYLCLPVPAAVKNVATEVVKGSKVKMLIDLSTTGPSVTKEVHEILSQRAIAFVSAPVSGGTVAAQHGTLAVMASGDAEAFKKAEPVLNIIGKNIFFLGEDPSLGQTMKIINNTLYATSMLASCEALVYGVKAGLDSKTMLDVLNVSSGRSFATLERIPQCALDRSFPVRFTTELLHKDIKMCLDEAEKIGAPMFVNQNARQFLAFAMTQGDGPKDNLFPMRHFEEWAGVQFGKKPE